MAGGSEGTGTAVEVHMTQSAPVKRRPNIRGKSRMRSNQNDEGSRQCERMREKEQAEDTKAAGDKATTAAQGPKRILKQTYQQYVDKATNAAQGRKSILKQTSPTVCRRLQDDRARHRGVRYDTNRDSHHVIQTIVTTIPLLLILIISTVCRWLQDTEESGMIRIETHTMSYRQ